MKLIYANSLYASIHQEVYDISREDLPLLLELVHSTDDDSLLLIIVYDPKECKVIEVNFDNTSDLNIYFLKQRYGMSTECLISNVETMFRSLEFLNLVKDIYINKIKNVPISPPLNHKLTVPNSVERRKRSNDNEFNFNLDMFKSSETSVGEFKIKINK